MPLTPPASEQRRRRRRTSGGTSGETSLRDYVCAADGHQETDGGVALLYPALLAFDHPLRYLAVTALVCLFVVVWLAVWTCLEVAWVRRVGRPR